jgi:PKD repeat protein
MTEARFPGSSRRLALAAAAACSFFFSGRALAATFIVNVGQGGTYFKDQTSGTSNPSKTTIHVGDTVEWNWVASTHSTTSGTCTSGGYYGGNCTPDGVWNSGITSGPHTFTRTFNTAGTFHYYCAVHLAMMQGSVVVQAAGTAPTAAFTFSPTAPAMGTAVNFTDASTGSPTSWAWNFGDPSTPATNTSSLENPSHGFSFLGTYTVTLTAGNAFGTSVATRAVTVSGSASTCMPDTETLCLNGGRFEVKAHWTKNDGSASGEGMGVKLTDDTGYFWFFDVSNVEMVVKVLNGCGLTQHYWVFAGGLTNQNVSWQVTDTQNGAVFAQTGNNSGVAFPPVQRTDALATCP